ncbi:Fork-head domain-containing protein [Mycena chlorophos]|uniref:Fork-head domain-containing protein n=1 Tax=Mycena chlorophos TaxID=658473 RepID=A0A8H6TI72_MYCCL|nr:Fork-head domain-containing protein [Mycena chlorophos]
MAAWTLSPASSSCRVASTQDLRPATLLALSPGPTTSMQPSLPSSTHRIAEDDDDTNAPMLDLSDILHGYDEDEEEQSKPPSPPPAPISRPAPPRDPAGPAPVARRTPVAIAPRPPSQPQQNRTRYEPYPSSAVHPPRINVDNAPLGPRSSPSPVEPHRQHAWSRYPPQQPAQSHSPYHCGPAVYAQAHHGAPVTRAHATGSPRPSHGHESRRYAYNPLPTPPYSPITRNQLLPMQQPTVPVYASGPLPYPQAAYQYSSPPPVYQYPSPPSYQYPSPPHHRPIYPAAPSPPFNTPSPSSSASSLPSPPPVQPVTLSPDMFPGYRRSREAILSDEIAEGVDFMRRKLHLPPNAHVSLESLPDTPDGSRPSHCLPDLIALAICGSEMKMLPLSKITWAIKERFRWYGEHRRDMDWQNSIRHALSLHKIFVRHERSVNDPGKGAYWRMCVTNGAGYARERSRTSGKKGQRRRAKHVSETESSEDESYAESGGTSDGGSDNGYQPYPTSSTARTRARANARAQEQYHREEPLPVMTMTTRSAARIRS